MDRIAPRTTARFRGNRPVSVWVVETWRQLNTIDYKRLRGVISRTKTDQDRAAVIVNATIATRAGKTIQKEIYYLIKRNNAWLIDELDVVDENVNPCAEKRKL